MNTHDATSHQEPKPRKVYVAVLVWTARSVSMHTEAQVFSMHLVILSPSLVNKLFSVECF